MPFDLLTAFAISDRVRLLRETMYHNKILDATLRFILATNKS